MSAYTSKTTQPDVLPIHSVGMRLVDLMLKIRQLKAFEMQMDREAGELDMDLYLHYRKMIQKNGRGLLVHGETTEEELAYLQQKLSPDGLAIYYWKP